ncbi:hypothetical protein DPMN_160969 [Dreissena polymorpha]|uniref:Uncharacterized protein n=1 Tax=Dreissena polymorpha TaxID=45954 RepID=A0A9D4EMK6_DREPO|nr:hypothetical protein DPMN_160969 [Dreissena polymorpha]
MAAVFVCACNWLDPQLAHQSTQLGTICIKIQPNCPAIGVTNDDGIYTWFIGIYVMLIALLLVHLPARANRQICRFCRWICRFTRQAEDAGLPVVASDDSFPLTVVSIRNEEQDQTISLQYSKGKQPKSETNDPMA